MMIRPAAFTIGILLMPVAAAAPAPGRESPAAVRLTAESQGAAAPAVPAPAGVVRELQTALAQARQRLEARDVAGTLGYVSDHYRTGPLTKAGIREQLIAINSLYDAVKTAIRLDDVQMVGDHAWVYSTGEVSGRLRFVGTWVVFLTWERELEVARREPGGWRLFGYQK